MGLNRSRMHYSNTQYHSSHPISNGWIQTFQRYDWGAKI